jgi:hypothetical protein
LNRPTSPIIGEHRDCVCNPGSVAVSRSKDPGAVLKFNVDLRLKRDGRWLVAGVYLP